MDNEPSAKTLNLRVWAYAGLLLLAALLVAVVPVTDRFLVRPVFDALQRRQALDDAWRSGRAIQSEIDQLTHLLGDWSNWDDTYAFAVSRDPSFIRANLGDWKVLESSSAINLCLIADTNGNVLYAAAYDTELGGMVQPAVLEGAKPELVRRLAPAIRPGHRISGLVATDEGLLAVAAQPILTTSGQGPSRGFIAFGRFIDSSVIRQLTERTRIDFRFFSAAHGALTPEEAQLVLGLAIRQPKFLTLGDGRSYIYEVLPDIEGRRVSVLRTPVGQELMDAGETVGRVMVLSLLTVLGGLAGLVVLLFVVAGGPVTREARRVLGYEQVSRAVRRQNQLWMAAAVTLYIAGIVAFSVWTGRRAERELLASVDQRLLVAARSQRYILPPDFHDRAITPTAIGREEEARLAAQYSYFAKDADLSYLYALVPYGTTFVFTASSLKEADRRERESWYFYPYHDAPPGCREALDGQRVVFASYRDRWGHFRSAIVPEMSPAGRHYLVCADYDISVIEDAVLVRMFGSAFIAVGFLALALPFVLVYRKAFAALTANLGESEASYRGLFDTVDEAIYLLDESGRFITVNRGAEAMYGHPRDWFEGRTPADVSAPGRNDMAATVAALQRAFAGQPQRFPFWGVRANGEAFPKDVQLYRGSYFGRTVILAVARDVTERMRAEEERLAMERRVLHGQKLESLGVLAGGIAHDFNNLLLGIMGNLELAIDEVMPGTPARQGLRDAMQAAQRAADLTRQMLAYSGRGRFIVQPLDLSAAVTANLNLLRASISKTARLELDLGEGLPAIEADPAQVQQIVMNLLINASEALGERPGVIAIATGIRDCPAALLAASRCEEKPPPGRYVFLEVRDTGCGMDAETMQRMFDPFFSTKATGRGLGMSAVLGIVRAHHAAILVESNPGHGTTFTVLFQSSALAIRGTSETAVPVPPRPRGERGCMLVVDDEVSLCDVASRMVERLGFTTLRAHDGAQAVAIFRERAAGITAVLMDLSMPNMDGVDACREMMRIRPGVPVVLMSGFSEQDAVSRFDGVGLAGFLQKPYKLDALQRVLARIADAAG